MKSFFYGLGECCLKPIPSNWILRIMRFILSTKSATLPAEEALRLLFNLDTFLYQMEGNQAIRYNDGVHTKHRHMKYHDFFVDRIHSGDNVLDIGCGIGELAHDIAVRSGASVVGIDHLEGKILKARERNSHPQVAYVVGDALKDLPESEFDVIVLSNVLEHLTFRPEFLGKLFEIYTPKKIIIRVPLFERDWRVPLKKELDMEWRLDSDHKIEYSQDTLINEIEEGGGVIQELQIKWGEAWVEVIQQPSAPTVDDNS